MYSSAERVAVWAPRLGAVPHKRGVRVCVWAPNAGRVELIVEHPHHRIPYPLERQPDGVFSGSAPGLTAGARYRFSLDGGPGLPDPASRHQPDGVHGPSMVIDASSFVWTDSAWRGVPREDAVIYELHVGTFSPEGTFAGVTSRLDHLVGLGITAIE
jgi:1,4-alpha-glucan branching enzyme